MDQIEEIKKKIDIVDFIGSYIPLKKAGRNFSTPCPFHEEKTPSFIVSPELQIFKCFGCQVGGDVIKFLELYEKMDFIEAVEFLANKLGIKLSRRGGDRQADLKKKLYEVNHLASEFYHFLLVKHDVGKKALEYVLKRGLTLETIKTFTIGFSPERQDTISSFLVKKGYSIPEILQTGLVVSTQRGGLIDRFRTRLVFPLFDHRSNIVGFSGRTIPNISPEDTAKYINTPETPIYHKSENLYGLWLTKSEIKKEKKVIVVEGEFDLISPYQFGIRNIVAIKGTAFTEEQARLIKRFTQMAILALDTDPAGIEAIKKSSQIADAVGLDVEIAVMPPGFKDPDELAHKDSDLLKKVFAKPIPVGDFVINVALKKYNPLQPLDKKRILNEVLPFLVRIENAVVKNHYYQKLAEILSVDLESVLIEADKVSGDKKVVAREQTFVPGASSGNRYHLLERQLISFIFAIEEWQWFKDKSWFSLLDDPLLKRIVKIAYEYLRKRRKISVNKFFKILPDELKSGFGEIYLFAKGDADLDPREIEKTIQDLKRENFRRQLVNLSLSISELETKGERKKVKQFEKKFVKVSRKLTQLGEN